MRGGWCAPLPGEPPILFADQTPSKHQIQVRRGAMKIVRREKLK